MSRAAIEVAGLPRAVAPFCQAVLIAEVEDERAHPIDAASITLALSRFAAGFPQPDRAALGSLWSLYYFNAVLIPAVAELLCRDRSLPIAPPAVRFAIAEDGTPGQVFVPVPGRAAEPADHGRRLRQCEAHVAAVIPLLVAATGVTARVLWSNAGTCLDWTMERVGAAALPAPRAELQALLGETSVLDRGRHPLAQPLRDLDHGGRERRVCCTRYRLNGVAACLPICPARTAALRHR